MNPSDRILTWFSVWKGSTLPVLTTLWFLTTRLRRVHSRSSLECLPAQGLPRAFPPTLTTTALYRSSLECLRPAPESRPQGAFPHLSRSFTTQSSVQSDLLSMCLCSTPKPRKSTSQQGSGDDNGAARTGLCFAGGVLGLRSGRRAGSHHRRRLCHRRRHYRNPRPAHSPLWHRRARKQPALHAGFGRTMAMQDNERALHWPIGSDAPP